MNFYQGCTLAAVLAFIIMVVFVVRAVLQITRTAEAAEYLLITTAEKVDQTKNTFDLIENVSGLLDAGWYKALKLGMDFVQRLKHK
ncbi:MAG: hypothetical protein J5601_05000 [Elusimicrobiaceae bacterium]|nr:hypothetical protein [Elusimicrobiaceae bacterium]